MQRVELYFDYASPWSYVAYELIPRKLPGVEVVFRTVYLRGLESFANGIPYSASKLQYFAQDLARCAEHEGVPVVYPSEFPVNGLSALRGALVAEERGKTPRYHTLAFRATWVEQRDIGKKEVAAEVLAEALGTSHAEALAAIAGEDVKARLRERTEAAVRRGVFGVPTFFVGESMFWGHDRMDYVARALGLAA